MNDWTSPVDIRPDHLEMVQDILREHSARRNQGLGVRQPRRRGRRRTLQTSTWLWKAPAYSTIRAMVGLEVAFEESDLPYTVDVVDLNAVSLEFKRIVESQRAPLPITGGQASASSDWYKAALGSVCTKIGSGATPRGGKDVYLEEGPYTLIRSQNVYNDSFHRDGLAFIGERHADEMKNVRGH